MATTPEEQRVTRSVYPSAAVLRQYDGPSTSRRFAEIPALGLYSWTLGSDAADDGVIAIRPGSGAYGAWIRTDSLGSAASDATLALRGVPLNAAQALADADTTLTSARRARRSVAQTANRADALPDGTTIGERRTVGRTLASSSGNVFKSRVMNSDGSVACWTNGPGEVELAWDGSRWGAIGSDVRERILTPYDFGGRGDGSYDDTTALAAWAASASVSGRSCRLHLPEGVWLTSAPIVVTTGVDNNHSVKITGHNGMSRGRGQGSVIKYTGAATASPIFQTLGLTGSHISDLVFDCNSLCDGPNCGVDATYTSSSGVTWERISVYYPRDVSGGSAFSCGNASVAGSQCDTIGFVDCLFTVQESLTPATNNDCWRANLNGNTKNFSFHNCSFYGGRRGINWEQASGKLTTSGNGSIGGCGVDVYQGGGLALLAGLQSERSSRALTRVGAESVTIIDAWEWHGGRLCSDDIPIHVTGGKTIVRGSNWENYRARRLITSINTGTDVVAFNGDENGAGLDTTNEEVEIRTTGTYPTYVDSVTSRTITYAPGTKLYVRDYNVLGGGLFNCKTSLTAGGAAMNWNGAGTGGIYFVSPVNVRATGTEQFSAVTGAFVSECNRWDSNANGSGSGKLSISDGSNDLLDPSYVTGNTNGIPTLVKSWGDQGHFGLATPERLSNRDNAIIERPTLALQRSVLDSPYDRAGAQHFSGASGTAWHVERFNYTEFYKAATTIDVYRRMPPRATIKRAIVEIVQQFANAAGNVTLNLYEATAFATILTACNLEAAAGTVYGELAAEHGTAWKAAIGVRPAVAWSASWSVLLNLVTTGGNWGNGTITNLTAGEFILYLEYEVPPRSGA